MEHGDVIDIDDLLGVSSPEQASLPVEEYNLDDFLDSAFHEGENGKSGKQYNAGKPWHKSKRGHAGQNTTDQTKSPPYQQDDATEAFLESLLATIKPNGEGNDLPLDINSDELRRFIAEYQVHDVEGVSGGIPIAARQTEDGASISSSASESLDSSSMSGEGGMGSKVKNNKKMMRGMRLLVANLLRSKTNTMASPTLGSEDERQKEVRRQKLKDKSKRREEKVLTHQNSDSSQSDVSFNHTPPTLLKNPTNLPNPSAACFSVSEGNIRNSRCNDRMEGYAAGMTEEAAKLFQVAVEEDKSYLERYLRSNPSLRDSRDGHGNVLMHVLCRYGKLESMQWLASGLCGHHVSRENNNCFTPTAIAVKYGRLDCVEWLINETKAKDELHSQDNRWSLLHIASRYGQEPCLRWLLQFMQNDGIHLDVLDRHSNSPSHLAARHGHLTCLQTLVEFNCDVTMVNGKKHTPCSLATKYNHNTCAQFLVVTETCISLSDQVTRLRRDLREYHQEKVLLKARLDDAIQCSDTLVRMHPRDTTQRIEQIQQQYVDLTNLLVRRIDDMHQKNERDAACRGSSRVEGAATDEWGEEIALCKERANELQDSCSQLLEEEHARQQSNQEGELSRIQEALHKLQQQDGLQDFASQKQHLEDHNLEPLEDMRKRLSKVSLIRSASPSVMNVPLSDKQDSVSLSSSYTSLSSSSSSLSMVSNGPRGTSKPTLQKQVSWEDQCHQRGASSNVSERSSDAGNRSSRGRNVQQEDLTSKVKRHLNDLISGKSSTKSHSNTTNCRSSSTNQYYSSAQDERDYKTPTNQSPTDGVLSDRLSGSMSSTGSNMKDSFVKQEQVKQSLDALMNSALPDLINSGDAKRGQVSPPSDSKISPSISEELSHSWHGGCGDQGRNRPLIGRLRISSATESAAKSSVNVRHARHSSENSPLSLKLASLRNQEDEVLHRPVTSSRSMVMSGPVFMRKLQSTGHVPGGEVSVHLDHFSHDFDGDMNGDSFHPRLNSDSSLSSATSSDVVWSDIDHQDGPDAGPMYKRRAGILNRTRRTGEGNRKSRNRHIKFALDEENCPSSPASDASYRRRDLSPIYESESHRQQREQQAAEFDSRVSNSSPCEYNPPVLGHREYRVNFYSSDDDDYETESPPPPDSPSITGSTSSLSHVQTHPEDGTLQDSSLDRQEEADKFWYESSEEDEGSALSASLGGTAERHICYL